MKALKNFEFKAFGAQKSQYDWTKILDGGIYALKKGEDFECEPGTFGSLARARAAGQSKNVRIALEKDEGTVVLQAYAMTAEEIAATKDRLAKYKAREAQKRAEKKAAANGVQAAPPTAADAPPRPAPKAATPPKQKV